MGKEPLLVGQIDMLLLSLLVRGPAHGYAIIAQLRDRSGGVLDLPEGTVYPALYRLEAAGLVESATEQVSGRVRRTYRITHPGRAALEERETSWREVVRGIDAILCGGAPGRA